jgi:DNA-binding transcriptional LysR family regulator
MSRTDSKQGDFRRVDLNLLVAFDAIMEECQVGRVAGGVFLGQPAMSHTLARLRDMLGDPLFVRSGNRLEPTAYARTLVPRVRTWLEEADELLFAKPPFNPARAEATYRIALPEGLEALLIPPLMARLYDEMPLIKLRGRSPPTEELLSMLDNDEIDLAITGSGLLLRDWHCQEPLFDCGFDYLYNESQLTLPRPATLQQVAEQEQVVSGVRCEATTVVDRFFEFKGLARRARAAADSLTAIGGVLASAPLISIQPSLYSPLFRQNGSLTSEPLARDELKMSFVMIWHKRNDGDALHVFLREKVLQGLEHLQGLKH